MLDETDMKESIIQQLSGMHYTTKSVPRKIVRDGKTITITEKVSGYFPINDKEEAHLSLKDAIEMANYCVHFFDTVYSTTYLEDNYFNRQQNVRMAAFDGMLIAQKLVDMNYKGSDTFAAEFAVWMASRIKAVLDRSLGSKLLKELASSTTNITQTVRREGIESEQMKSQKMADKILGIFPK
ncbi:MAG: hypothetical protein QXS81_01470 [Candidatus Micrarchaeaceae archaeon]